jgi:phosphatidylethanolamine/phosphatidyl-N-methylethanolamine N-methyltransferase
VRLARSAAGCITDVDHKIVEIGAGTGRLTRALFERGVSPEHLVAVELDQKMCTFLKSSLHSLFRTQDDIFRIICGDALHLKTLIPDHWMGQVRHVVSAIPLMYLNEHLRLELMNAAFDVMHPQGTIIHVTYSPFSPLGFTDTIEQTRVVSQWLNVPPGFVWRFGRKK